MNNGYRWISDNEVEILRDNDKVIEKVDGNINVEKKLLYQNIVEIYNNKILDIEHHLINYIALSIINNKLLTFQLVATIVGVVLNLLFSNIAFLSIITKIFFALLVYFEIQNLIYFSRIKELQNEYNASEKLMNVYINELENTKTKNVTNSFHKSMNFVSFSEYNDIFYTLADKQIDANIKKDKVKKRTLKKNR